jgi:hypothetical protein
MRALEAVPPATVDYLRRKTANTVAFVAIAKPWG